MKHLTSSIWPSLIKKKFSYRSEDEEELISVLNDEALARDSVVPAFVFNRKCQRITRLYQTFLLFFLPAEILSDFRKSGTCPHSSR